MNTVVSSPCVFLTQEMVNDFVEKVKNDISNSQTREAKLEVYMYLTDLLREGKMLTIDIEGNIKLWEGERQ